MWNKPDLALVGKLLVKVVKRGVQTDLRFPHLAYGVQRNRGGTRNVYISAVV
jgi:hypothetical protein